MINEIFREIEYSTLFSFGWNYLRIAMEKALFSLNKKNQYKYKDNLLGSLYNFDFIIAIFKALKLI